MPEFAIKAHEENNETYSKKRKKKRFDIFTLSWSWIWLAFSLWNWKIYMKKEQVSGETMWMYERGTGRPRVLTLEACFPLLAKRYHRSLCHTGHWTMTVCLQKCKKCFERNLLHLFLVYLSREFKTEKKWKCTFSNQHWFLLQERIILVLKPFFYPKFFLSFHDFIIQNL